MSNAHSLNRAAFCLLADIPDFWRRTQTSRATDLLVNLNTKYCQNGKSTVARLCALARKSTEELRSAISILNEKKSIKVSTASRMSSTLQYLKSVNISLSCPNPTLVTPPAVLLVNEIKQALGKGSFTTLCAYTDGSTKARSQDPNSGCGIYLTDEKHCVRFGGGDWWFAQTEIISLQK